MKHRAAKLSATLLVAGLALALCGGLASRNSQTGSTRDPSGESTREASGDTSGDTSGESSGASPTTTPSKGTATASRTGVVTLAFAGDMHFQLHLAALLDQPRRRARADHPGPGRRGRHHGQPGDRDHRAGRPGIQGARGPRQRYYFRTSPAALDVLDAAGVDVVSVANNHGADYGTVGLQDTLRAARTSPVAVLGVGRNGGPPSRRTGSRSAAPTSPSSPPMLRGARARAASGAPDRVRRASPPPAPRGRVPSSPPCARRAGRPTWWWCTCTGAVSSRAARPGAAHGRAGVGRRGSRRHRGQPRARPARVRVAGRHLRELRPGEFPLVPQPSAGHRCPPAAHRERRRRRGQLGPGPDPDLGPRLPLTARTVPGPSPTGVGFAPAPTSRRGLHVPTRLVARPGLKAVDRGHVGTHGQL